jgi:lysophospholipid acyltransferase (LPLAT)-like uncharacterized protein
MLRSIIGNSFVQFLIGRTIGGFMLLVGITTRWTRVNQAAVEPFWVAGHGRSVACIWHGRFTLVHKLWSFGRGKTKALFLISRSREGGIVAHTSQTVGADVIRGSAAKRGQMKGGMEATREVIRQIEGGACVGMTPDGPRGPRMRAKMGPVQIAKMAQVPLLPLAYSTSNRYVFDSWDRFILPLPFGRGALIWADPITPPSPDADDAEMEAVRLKLESELNRISAEADRIAGVEVIEPDAPRASARPSMAAAADAEPTPS